MFRASLAAALVAGLAALPACKKKSESTNDTSTQQGQSPPPPQPGAPSAPPAADGRFPPPPVGPLFRGQGPQLATARQTSINNLKNIGLGLHGFNDSYGHLPAGYADATGKPGLSWRVAILPFIEQENLFKQFKLNEPWDGPHNIKLVAQMPKAFAAPGQQPNGWTFYRGFSGNGAWLPASTHMGKPGEPIRAIPLLHITDGTANTILVAEAADPVIWTKPDEIAFQPPNAPKLGGVFESGTVVLLGHGGTRTLSRSMSAKNLVNAIGIADGQVVTDWDK